MTCELMGARRSDPAARPSMAIRRRPFPSLSAATGLPQPPPHQTPAWFTTFFLQPLPYLVTPYGPENCQLLSSFFVGAQTVVSLLQTTQIISDVCFITDHVAYACSNKTQIVSIETEHFFFFLPGVDEPHVYVRAWALGCFYSHISTRTFRRAQTASVDSCAEIKSAPSVA